jgi:hypothetical protein
VACAPKVLDEFIFPGREGLANLLGKDAASQDPAVEPTRFDVKPKLEATANVITKLSWSEAFNGNGQLGCPLYGDDSLAASSVP